MAEGKFTQETIKLTENQQKSRRARNIALALTLIGFVVLLYVATWIKFDVALLQRQW